MLSSLKEKFQKKESGKPKQPSWIESLSTREKAIAGITACLAMVSLGGLMSFNPGLVSGFPKHDGGNASIPQFTKSVGPAHVLKDPSAMMELGEMPELKLPSSLPGIPKIFNPGSIPSRLPGFNPPAGSLPLPGSINMPGARAAQIPEYMTKAYAVHAAMSSNMKGVLGDGFSLANMSSAPSGAGANRFVTSYVAKNASGTDMEKMELVTIARSSDMKDIKKASDALYSLVEDSDSVNIIEDGGDWLAFNIAGSKGYQLTRISVKDDAITFAAYVNLTTNIMPSMLRDEWMAKLASL